LKKKIGLTRLYAKHRRLNLAKNSYTKWYNVALLHKKNNSLHNLVIISLSFIKKKSGVADPDPGFSQKNSAICPDVFSSQDYEMPVLKFKVWSGTEYRYGFSER
jgi:hypothetical protein